MNRRTKQMGVILCLVAMVGFAAAFPIYKWLSVKAVNIPMYEKTKALVAKNPQLQSAWDNAVQDGVLTWSEVKEIAERGGEKFEEE